MAEEHDKETRGLLGFVTNHSEAFVSVAALVTAVAAVVITMEQTKVMREEAELERRNARISVMPSVWVATFIENSADVAYFKIVLNNKGLGPGVIESFEVSYKDEAVYNWDALARVMAADMGSARTFEGDTVRSSRSPVSPGLLLEAGGTAEPLQIYQDADVEALKMFIRGTPHISVSVCYCSLYGDCFRTELFRRPQQVEACAAAEQPFVSHGFFRN